MKIIHVAMFMVIAMLAAPVVLSLLSRSRPTLGLHGGRLGPCGSLPNCVSSLSREGPSRIDHFPLSVPPEEAMAILVELVGALPNTQIIEQSDGYLRAEVTSRILRFADDLELYVDEENQRVQVRSASRVGFSDLGVNRKRVEALRAAFVSRTEG